MTVANLGWDLQAASGGRAIVGLGSQIRAHIERRFSMPWSAPAARMREFATAVRAIWGCWQDGRPLRIEGEHYHHTLMTPFFTPDPLECGRPRLFLAGVGPAMTRVAGDLADGFFAHPFCTGAYLDAVTRPALAAGAAGSGAAFEIAWPVMIATGTSDEQRRDAEFATRAQIAFYGSTPAYRPVLDHHDRGELQPELRARSQTGDWAAMADLVDDELFDLIAIRGTPVECGHELARRTVGRVQRVGINAPYATSGDLWPELLKAFHDTADLNKEHRRPGHP
jgi:probable F420-dependent oxidoreductase